MRCKISNDAFVSLLTLLTLTLLICITYSDDHRPCRYHECALRSVVLRLAVFPQTRARKRDSLGLEQSSLCHVLEH